MLHKPRMGTRRHFGKTFAVNAPLMSSCCHPRCIVPSVAVHIAALTVRFWPLRCLLAALRACLQAPWKGLHRLPLATEVASP